VPVDLVLETGFDMERNGRLPSWLVEKYRQGASYGVEHYVFAVGKGFLVKVPGKEKKQVTFGSVSAVSFSVKECPMAIQGMLSPVDGSYVMVAATTHTSLDLKSLTAREWELVQEAKDVELGRFKGMGVYERVRVSVSVGRPLDMKWVLTDKRVSETVRKFKARLVARGDQDKREGLDKSTSVPPVLALRCLLVYAVGCPGFQREWFLQADVKTAFLHAELDSASPVYVRPPPDHEDFSRWLWRLRKAVYGLPEAARAFELFLTRKLEGIGWIRSAVFDGVFVRRDPSDGHVTGLLFAYVDDLLFFDLGGNPQRFVDELSAQSVDVEVNGVPSTLVGIDFAFTDTGIELRQSRYAKSIVVAKGAVPSMPVPEGALKEEDNSAMLAGEGAVKGYRSMLGKFAYLAHTRPDLCFAVSYFGKFANNPTERARALLEDAVRYAQATADRGVWFPFRARSTPEVEIVAWCDASFGSYSGAYAKSGYVITVNGCAAQWHSGKQRTVARSTLKAETCALHECVDVITMVGYFYRQFGLAVRSTLFSDADNLLMLLRSPHPRPGEWSLIPLLKVLQKKLAGTPESLSDKELRDLVVPILSAEGLLTHCGYALGNAVVLRFVSGVENPADVLTKPREVSLLSELVCRSGSGGTAVEVEGVSSPVRPATEGKLELESQGSMDEEQRKGDEDEERVVCESADAGAPVEIEMPQFSSEGASSVVTNEEPLRRDARTGYGLRPSSVLRAPDRLAFLVQQGVGALIELLRGVPDSIPVG
jgi:hypothetical protein